MFGLGIFEIIIILFVALLFIGPKKLPEVAKNLGKGLRDFQNALKGITDNNINDGPPNRVPEHENDFHEDHHHGEDESEVIVTTATKKETENIDKKETKKES